MPGRLLTAAIIASVGGVFSLTAAAVFFIKDKILEIIKERKRRAAPQFRNADLGTETVLLDEEEL